MNYRVLNPKEIIETGDQYEDGAVTGMWIPCKSSIGYTSSYFAGFNKVRRPIRTMEITETGDIIS